MNLNLLLFEIDFKSHQITWTYFNNVDVVDIFYCFANIYIRYFAVFFIAVFFFSFAVKFVESLVTGKSVNDLGEFNNE